MKKTIRSQDIKQGSALTCLWQIFALSSLNVLCIDYDWDIESDYSALATALGISGTVSSSSGQKRKRAMKLINHFSSVGENSTRALKQRKRHKCKTQQQ
ncbi:MAG: hypothetical protein HOE64_14255 [Nitrospina sp.]|jgi:hypothetical protein|nr:hypothetical protein [Nitrospina sp.]